MNVEAMLDWLLRVPEPSEIVDLRWDQVDFATATLRVPKAKQGRTCAQTGSRRTTAARAFAQAYGETVVE